LSHSARRGKRAYERTNGTANDVRLFHSHRFGSRFEFNVRAAASIGQR